MIYIADCLCIVFFYQALFDATRERQADDTDKYSVTTHPSKLWFDAFFQRHPYIQQYSVHGPLQARAVRHGENTIHLRNAIDLVTNHEYTLSSAAAKLDVNLAVLSRHVAALVSGRWQTPAAGAQCSLTWDDERAIVKHFLAIQNSGVGFNRTHIREYILVSDKFETSRKCVRVILFINEFTPIPIVSP